MKLILVLALVVMIGYMLLHAVSGEALANIYCRNQAQEEAPRSMDAGMSFRNRDVEIDYFRECIDELEKATLAEVLVKYSGKEDKTSNLDEDYSEE